MRVHDRVKHTLNSLSECGLDFKKVKEIKIDYKEMGEFSGDIILPVITVSIKEN